MSSMIKNSIFALLLFFAFNSCKSQSQPAFIGEKSYDLTNIDSNLDVRGFYSKALVNGPNWEQYKDSKERYRHSFRRDSSYGPNEREDGKDSSIKYVFYSHINASTDDKLADWSGHYFNQLDMIANQDNQLMAIGAVAKETDPKMYDMLLKQLDEKFGKHTKLHKDFFGDVAIDQWQSDDLEIQLVPIGNKGIASQQKVAAPFNCYLYIFMRKHPELVHKYMREGDFMYAY